MRFYERAPILTSVKKWILQTLILSATLNVVLIAIFFCFLIRDNPLHFAFEPKKDIKIEKTTLSLSFLERLQTLNFEQLVELLLDERKLEHGYRVSDFAASALAQFHDFDLLRALNKKELPERRWIYEGKTFTLHPGLDCEGLYHFAKTERYPFTLKGLFRKLETNEPELLTYFCHTPPFILLEQLFSRTGLQLNKGHLLALVREGGYEPLAQFYEAQESGCDLSEKSRRPLLLDYINKGSKTAAYLLLVTDFAYALRELGDQEVSQLLGLIDEKTEEALLFASELARSPRGNHVVDLAKSRLASFTGEEIAGHYIQRPGIGGLRPNFRSTPPAAPAPSTHLVQPGESLWLIARKYNVSLERLMEINHLSSTVIKSGKTLKIP